MKTVLILILLLPAYASANDKLGTIAILAIDWAQTRYISSNCNNPVTIKKISYKNNKKITSTTTTRLYESNPLLGTCPSLAKVNAYFLTTGALLYFIPNKYHSIIQPIAGQFIISNNSIGIQLLF